MERELIMKQWDSWRRYIASGGKGSWPRDAFESLLDYFEEEIENCNYAQNLNKGKRHGLLRT